MLRWTATFFCAASILATAASAQESPRADAQAITVIGQRNSKQEIQDFVKSLTPVPFGSQMSRFEHSVCPAVFGLARPQAAAVEERVRVVAKTIGITVSGQGCAPNLAIIATPDKKAFIKALWKHRSDYFDSPHQARDLERQPGPAAAWNIGGPPISARGVDLYVDPIINQYLNQTTEASSRITQPVRPQFDAAVVVVEKKALIGLTTTQLADYAAIRALTGADPAKLGNAAAPTILHVFDVPIGGQAPITMTKWDFAFLRGYYDARPVLRTGARRSAISESMGKALQTPNGK